MANGSAHGKSPGPGDPGPLSHILVAVDGSESSMRAMAMAARMAKQFEARLTAISVASLPEFAFVDYSGASPAVTEFMRKAAEEEASAALERARAVAKQQGVEADVLMEFGPVKEGLLSAVAKYRPDMLVVGRRGLSRLRKLLLGSVSEAMIRYAECPILVVK